MTRDDILRMAQEAGMLLGRFDVWDAESSDLERFFHMAYAAGAVAERNKLAHWMIQRSYATGHGDTIEDLLKELEGQVRESEREACIELTDSRCQCAWAIKARGQV